jgi:PAS domain S-box-containing protein
MDLLSNVLGRAGNPGAVGSYLTEEIRELTGASTVLLLQCPGLADGTRHVVIAVNPERRRGWAESPAASSLYEIVHGLPAPRLWHAEEPSEAADLLRDEGFALSLAVPLEVGGFRVGGMLLLGLPDEEHVDGVLSLLTALSTVVALVLRNAFLYEEQEQTIQERTAELRTSNERLQAELAERRQAQEAQREQYSTLRGIIDNTTALIFSVDRQYRYTSFNQAHAAVMKALYGVDVEAGRSLLDCMTVADDREEARRNLDRALRGEAHVRSAYSGDQARSRLFFEVSHNPVRAEDGAVIGVAVVAQDVTERKRAEDALRAKDQAIHRAYVDVIWAVTGGRLILMTEMELARALGRPVGDKRAFSRPAEIAGIRHGVALDVRRGIPGVGDPSAFMAAVSEALTNSLRHAGSGTCLVHKSRGCAQIVVADQGPGIDFSALPKATLLSGYSTRRTLGMGFTIMLGLCDRVLLTTSPGGTTIALEVRPHEKRPKNRITPPMGGLGLAGYLLG